MISSPERLSPFFLRLKGLHIILLLFIVGWITFQNAVFHPFVHDDILFIQLNSHISDWSVDRWLTTKIFGDIKSAAVNAYYRPLLEVVYRLQYMVFGLNPHGYHFTNILFHIVNSCWVYFILRRVIGTDSFVPLGASLLFLVHPVQSEAVACISGISNTLYAFFFLWAFYVYAAVPAGRARSAARHAGVLALFFLSLCAKEQAVVFPFLLLGYEWFICRKEKGLLADGMKRAVPYFILLAVYLIVRQMIVGPAMGAIWNDELALRILSIPRTLWTYLGAVFAPVDLHYYRNTDILAPYVLPAAGLAVLAAALGTLVWRCPRETRGLLGFGLYWFIIVLGPVLNIVPLVNEYSFILTAEHFLYLPVFGIFVFVLVYFERRLRMASVISALSFIVILVLCVSMTVSHNTIWADEITLFERTVRYEPKFARARMLLGKAYYNQGRYAEGIRQHAAALEIMSSYLGKVKPERPAYEVYLNYKKNILWDLIFGLEAQGLYAAARPYYKEAIRLQPQEAALYNAYGVNHMRTQEAGRALEIFEQTHKLAPGDISVLNNLAVCHAELGQLDPAEKYLREVLAADPQSQAAKSNLEKIRKLRGL